MYNNIMLLTYSQDSSLTIIISIFWQQETTMGCYLKSKNLFRLISSLKKIIFNNIQIKYKLKKNIEYMLLINTNRPK